MKRLIAAAVLLIFVIAVYISGYLYIQKICETATDMINECINLYDENKDSVTKAKEIQKYWNKKESILSAFANHAHIDDIELAIDTLVIYSNSKENKYFYEHSSTTKTLIHQLLEESKPSMHSIL